MRTDAERARQVGAKLLEALGKQGIFGVRWMPEDLLPQGIEAGSEAHLRFITLTVSIDYMRDADQLWDAARETLEDRETAYLFDPDIVARTGPLQVTTDLGRRRLSRKLDNDAQTWQRICVTLARDFGGQVSALIAAADGDAVRLLTLIRSPRYRNGFPFLKGPKIGPLWIRMLHDNCGVLQARLDEVPLPVDIHTAQATIQTGGVIPGAMSGSMADLRQAVQAVWHEALSESAGLAYPLQLDEPLWLLSRLGCRTTIGWPCDYRDRCPVIE